MNRVPKLLCAVILLCAHDPGEPFWLIAQANRQAESLSQKTVPQLERRLAEIESNLDRLAQNSLRSGVGSIGYRSRTHADAAHTEWIKIDLGDEYSIEQVVLVPALLRDAVSGFRAEGFPLQFRVVVGTGTGANGKTVASFDADDSLLPRIAPVVIPFDTTVASWVLVEADLLTSRQFDGRFLLQFAEVLVFCGEENVAQGQPLDFSSNEPSGSAAWEASFAVDGFMPYLMNGAGGSESLAFVSQVNIEDRPSITIDLESVQPVSQINLHLVDQSDTVPQTYSGNFGVPRLLQIEGASHADFSDAKVLVEYQHENIFDTGPIIMRRFPKTNCRFVRLTATDPFVVSQTNSPGARFGFSEIEIIANGTNVALGKTAQAELQMVQPRSLAALTDGNNYYGQILPLQSWLTQLATRHDLEAERPLVEAELNLRYQRQRTNLNRLIWLATLLAFGVFGAIVIGWNLHLHSVQKTRERIAADLHDELGANFHAIGLLSDLAQSASDKPEKLKPLMRRMREITERTGTAARNCVNMLESKELYENITEEMRRTSTRIMADLDHEITFHGEEHLSRLKPRKRIDLFLFYKECLINIIRHSEATQATTQLTADRHQVCLQVTDNGRGLAEFVGNGVPLSLRRRARLLGGNVTARPADNGGTCVTLKLHPTKIGLLRMIGFQSKT